MPVTTLEQETKLTSATYSEAKSALMKEGRADVKKALASIESTVDKKLAEEQLTVSIGRGMFTAVSIGYSFIPVIGGALCELTKSAKELLTVDVASYGRMKTEQVSDFIEKYKKDFDLKPAEVHVLLETAVDGLKRPADTHLYLQLELTKNLGAMLLDQTEHFDFRFDEVQLFLQLDYTERQEDKRCAQEEKIHAFEKAVVQSHYEGVRSSFGLLAGIGAQFNIPELAKFGQIGSVSVEIVRMTNSLKSAFDMGGLLTFLNPASALGAGLCSLLSFFGPARESETAVVLKALQNVATQMREFRLETRRQLADIDEHVLAFADSMTRHYLTLMEKLGSSEQFLHDFVGDRFNKMEASLADVDHRQTEIGRHILYQETKQLIHGVNSNSENSAFFTEMPRSNYYMHLNRFTFWMSDVSNHHVHNGHVQITTTADHELLALKSLEGKDPLQYLSVLFYCLNAQLGMAASLGLSPAVQPFSINVVNPFLWLYVTDAYLKLVLSVPQYFEDNQDVRRNSIHEADKLIDAARRLQTSPTIYFSLFALYSHHLSEAKKILAGQKEDLQSRLKIDVFGDVDSQVSAHPGVARLPDHAQVVSHLAGSFETPAIPLASFQEQIVSSVPKMAILLCDLGLGSLKVEVSFEDGRVGCYGQHLPHLREKEAEHLKHHGQLSYQLDGFGEVKDYAYYERLLNFSVLFVPVENQTQPIKVSDVSVATLMTQDRGNKGRRFHGAAHPAAEIKDAIFFSHVRKHGDRRYLIAGPRRSEHKVFKPKEQLEQSLASSVKRLASQLVSQEGLALCQTIFDRHASMQEQQSLRVLENKMQEPGQSFDRLINKIRTLLVVFNGSLQVAGLSEALPAMRAPLSHFFSEASQLSAFQKTPGSVFKSMMTGAGSAARSPERDQAAQDFQAALLSPNQPAHPLETIVHDCIDHLAVLPRLVGRR